MSTGGHADTLSPAPSHHTELGTQDHFGTNGMPHHRASGSDTGNPSSLPGITGSTLKPHPHGHAAVGGGGAGASHSHGGHQGNSSSFVDSLGPRGDGLPGMLSAEPSGLVHLPALGVQSEYWSCWLR